jgi:hypothetical protein
MSLCRTGNEHDKITVSEEKTVQREREKEKKEMEEEQRMEEREIEPEAEQVGPAVQTVEEDKEITEKSGETSTDSAEPTFQGDKEKEEEVEDGVEVGPAVEGDREKEAEVSHVEIVKEIKESIAGPVEVVTTELVGPAYQGLEAVAEREVAELDSEKVVEVTAAETLEKPLEEQAALVIEPCFVLLNLLDLFIMFFLVVLDLIKLMVLKT